MAEETAQLSDRECEILRQVATGATNQQIADNLDISVNTVKVHLRNIFGKIGASSRTEATVYAVRSGLIEVAAPVSAAVSETEVAPPVVPSELPVEVPSETVAETLPTAKPSIPVELVETTPTLPVAPVRRNALWLWAVGGLLAMLLLVGMFMLRMPAVPFDTPAVTSAAPTDAATGSNRWKQSYKPLIQPRSDFAVAAFDGKMYVIGGSGRSGSLASVERFDPNNNIWVPLSDKLTAVAHVQAATIGGRIYVPGGELSGGTVTTTLEAYDPRSERWQQLKPLPEPRSRYALASVEGRLYLFGGWNGSEYRNEVFVYDPTANEWEKRSAMPTARRNAAAAVVDTQVFVVGGENASGPLSVNERFDTTTDPNSQPWSSTVPLPEPIAAPAIASIANIVLVFDPQRRSIGQFSPDTESWVEQDVPAEIAISSRAIALRTSVFVFGSAPSDQASVVSEYQAVYTTFIPFQTQ